MIYKFIVQYALAILGSLALFLLCTTIYYVVHASGLERRIELDAEKMRVSALILEVQNANVSEALSKIEIQNKELELANTKLANQTLALSKVTEEHSNARITSATQASTIRKLRALPTQDVCVQANDLFNKYK